MLCNLHDTFFVTILYFQSVSDCRQFFVFKFNVHNRSHNLYDFSWLS